MPKEMPFRLLTERFRENCFCGWCISLEPTSVGQVVKDWFSQSTGNENFLPIHRVIRRRPGRPDLFDITSRFALPVCPVRSGGTHAGFAVEFAETVYLDASCIFGLLAEFIHTLLPRGLFALSTHKTLAFFPSGFRSKCQLKSKNSSAGRP